MSNWISVKERLPEFYVEVLICDDRDSGIGRRFMWLAHRATDDNGGWYWALDGGYKRMPKDVRWWQLLPELPKEEA